MSDKILEALAKLDPGNDNHWTAEGAPRIETLRLLAGDASITRDQVTAADQSFNREAAKATKRAQAEADAEKAEAQRKEAEALAMQTNVNANGDLTGTPEVPNTGTAAPGELKALDGTTANPNADSDNQGAQLSAEDAAAAFNETFEEEQEQLRKRIESGDDYLSQLMAQKDDLEKQIAEVTSKLDGLKSRVKSKEPSHREQQMVIQQALAASQARREARAETAVEDGRGRLHVPLREQEKIDQRLQTRPRANPTAR